MKPYSLYSDSQVLFDDGERVLHRGWRVGDDGDRSGVLVVLPATEHPSPSSLDRLTHEYGLLRMLLELKRGDYRTRSPDSTRMSANVQIGTAGAPDAGTGASGV